MRILFIFLFSGLIHCQEYHKAIDNFLYDSDRHLFMIISGDSIFYYNHKSKLVEKNKFLNRDYNPKALVPISNNNFSYYPSNQTGVVVNKNLERVNKSLSNNFFINSSFFVHNDTLFRIGGYGFWTKYRGVSYYDTTKHIWNAYPIDFIDKEYFGILNPRISKVDDNNYLLFSGKIFDDNNPLIEYANKKIYQLDIENKTLIYKGDCPLNLGGVRVITDIDYPILLEKDGLKILDWNNNSLNFFSCTWTTNVSKQFRVFLIENNFYYIKQTNEGYKLSSSRFNFFDTKPSNVENIFNTNNYLWIILLSSGILIFYLLSFYFNKFNEIRIYKTHLNYKFKRIAINKVEYKILNILSSSDRITTNQIHHFLNTKDLHPHHIYKLIPEVMRDLAKTLNLITSNNSQVFSVSKNKTDRRISEYSIAKEFKLRLRE